MNFKEGVTPSWLGLKPNIKQGNALQRDLAESHKFLWFKELACICFGLFHTPLLFFLCIFCASGVCQKHILYTVLAYCV